MLEDYKNALKSGQRAYRACVARGQSPYLAVLDDILVNVNIVAQEPLGLVEIPAESIVGTKTSGRHTAFAPNFMPLLEPDTEFAGKWSNLCDAHLEEGIHTPIIAYEFLNKFYVQEGNKRVSVLKYFDAVRIAGTVTRLVPERNDSLENRIYYEFLDFYKLSKVNDVHFSRLGGYAKLQTLVCKASGESWTDDDRLSFSSFYTMFLHEHNAESSAWVRAHDKGIEALQQAFPDRVFITRKENIEPEVDAEQVLEDVAHDNADVVFTSSARMHTACLKVAAQHPKTRILNCSLNAPHPLVRTYYPRTYEVTYLLGILAGVLTKTDRVGYVAANPVYGIPAAVNAYAQGLKTVRPDAKVVLRWACLPDPAHPLDFSDRPDVEIFYARDNREPEGTHRDYGLVRRMPDGSLQPLGLPVWRWDTFYIEIVRSIFDGAWDSDAAGARAVNYWWGMRSGAEEIDYSKDLPAGTLQLLDLMEKMLHEDDLRIFPEDLYAQGHVLHSPEAVVYSPKELMEMDWLDECVEGALPHYDELDVKTHVLMAINGLNTLKGFVK